MAAAAPTHPKLLAVMKPRGTSRGKSRAAIVTPAEASAFEQPDFVAEPPKVDPTKVAAASFAAAHPEGTKALLAKLLAEKAEREAGEPKPVDFIAGAIAINTAARKARQQTTPGAPAPRPTVAAVQRPSAEPVTPAGMPEPEPMSSGAAVGGPTAITQAFVEAVTGLPVIPTERTREGWMLAAVEAMRSWLPEGNVVPDVRISFGWPGGRGSKKGVRGQCWYTTDDLAPAIFVSPDQNDPVTVLGIILHEMVHASGQKQHHPSGFGKVAGPMGFEKSFTSSENKTPELVARLAELAERLGPIDHSRVNAGTGLYGASPQRPTVQTTRMVKLECPACGYTVRTTRKWIAVGLPSCPTDGESLAIDAAELDRL